MKIEKFKVLLYLKKSGMDKNGKAPIMGRITVNRTMAQFSCKLSCTPSLWNCLIPKNIKLLHDRKYSSKRSEFLGFYLYICHVIRKFCYTCLQH